MLFKVSSLARFPKERVHVCALAVGKIAHLLDTCSCFPAPSRFCLIAFRTSLGSFTFAHALGTKSEWGEGRSKLRINLSLSLSSPLACTSKNTGVGFSEPLGGDYPEATRNRLPRPSKPFPQREFSLTRRTKSTTEEWVVNAARRTRSFESCVQSSGGLGKGEEKRRKACWKMEGSICVSLGCCCGSSVDPSSFMDSSVVKAVLESTEKADTHA